MLVDESPLKMHNDTLIFCMRSCKAHISSQKHKDDSSVLMTTRSEQTVRCEQLQVRTSGLKQAFSRFPNLT